MELRVCLLLFGRVALVVGLGFMIWLLVTLEYVIYDDCFDWLVVC